MIQNDPHLKRFLSSPIVELLTIEGKCSCGRAKPAHFGIWFTFGDAEMLSTQFSCGKRPLFSHVQPVLLSQCSSPSVKPLSITKSEPDPLILAKHSFHREQKVLSCYEFFFAQGTPQLIAHVLRLIREKLKKEKIVRVKLLDGTVKQVEHYELTRASLGYLVDLLVSLDVPFYDDFIGEGAKATDGDNSSELSRKKI